jgi:hypothetical protein
VLLCSESHDLGIGRKKASISAPASPTMAAAGVISSACSKMVVGTRRIMRNMKLRNNELQ